MERGAGDTLLIHDPRNQRVNRYAPDGSSAGSFRLVFEEGVAWKYRGTSSGDEYRIKKYSSAGQLERIITKEWEPSAVTDADKGVLTNHLEARFLRQGIPPAAVQRRLSRWSFHEYFPAFQSLWAGPAGTIWVQRVQPPSQMSEAELSSLDLFLNEDEASAPHWDVFDSEGRYLGVVTLPRLFTPKLFRADKIYGIWLDEFDLQYVGRLRIVGDLRAEAT